MEEIIALRGTHDPQWTQAEYKPGGGRDALGIETLSESILSELLPGITNQTRRARYYAFWAWVLRDFIRDKFHGDREESKIMVYVTSFGYRHGVPADSDLVFDVRFLPNPNYLPRFRKLTGNNPGVARYIRSFPQTTEFLTRISDLLVYLLPHYIREGKSYLTVSIGCTGGQHRSVMIANEIRRTLADSGFKVKISHRDMPR